MQLKSLAFPGPYGIPTTVGRQNLRRDISLLRPLQILNKILSKALSGLSPTIIKECISVLLHQCHGLSRVRPEL